MGGRKVTSTTTTHILEFEGFPKAARLQRKEFGCSVDHLRALRRRNLGMQHLDQEHEVRPGHVTTFGRVKRAVHHSDQVLLGQEQVPNRPFQKDLCKARTHTTADEELCVRGSERCSVPTLNLNSVSSGTRTNWYNSLRSGPSDVSQPIIFTTLWTPTPFEPTFG